MKRLLLFGVGLYGALLLFLGLFIGVVALGATDRFTLMESGVLGVMILLSIASTGILLYGFHSTNRDIRLDRIPAGENSDATD